MTRVRLRDEETLGALAALAEWRTLTSTVHRLAVLAWLVRVALVALALQLGGVIHGAADVLTAVGVIAAEHEECPTDGGCSDCLPGCPNCHCAGALRTVIPEGGLSLELLVADGRRTLRVSDGSAVPLGPTLPSVYRPPRTFVRNVVIS